MYEKLTLSNNNKNFNVHITATGSLTDNPKSLAEMERTMHHREGSLWYVSSTADHPMDEKKICGTKRSYPPPDWPFGVTTTCSIPSIVTTGMTTQEITMSSLDAGRPPCTTLFAREATLSSNRHQPTMYPKHNRGNDWWQRRNIIYFNKNKNKTLKVSCHYPWIPINIRLLKL